MLLGSEWDRAIFNLFGEDERLAFVLGTWIVSVLSFWIPSLFFELCRDYGYLENYRIDKKATPDKELKKKAIIAMLTSHALQPIVLFLSYPIYQYSGCSIKGKDLPPFHILLCQIVFMIIFGETGFYWGHRLLHYSPFLYKNVHKMHHHFVYPVGLSAQYIHWFESILEGFLPTVIPQLLLGVHVSFIWTWGGFVTWEAVDGHSGYELPYIWHHYFDPASFHYYHHSKNRGNYGSGFMPWDRWMGTLDPAYVLSEEQKYKRKD